MIRSTGVRSITVCVVMLVVLAACSPTVSGGRPASLPAEPVPVTFDVPEGFARDDSYTILVPLHPLRATQWVVPTGTRGLDVIAVTSYVLDDDVTDRPDTALVSALDGYARKVAASSATPPVPTTVAGYRAFRQSIEQPSRSGPLAYDATFVFAGRFMVQVLCQHRDQPDLVRAGCATVLATLRLTFA